MVLCGCAGLSENSLGAYAITDIHVPSLTSVQDDIFALTLNNHLFATTKVSFKNQMIVFTEQIGRLGCTIPAMLR